MWKKDFVKSVKRTFQVMGTSCRKACIWLRVRRSPGPPRRPVGLESGARAEERHRMLLGRLAGARL